jgi:hypothetical protein
LLPCFAMWRRRILHGVLLLGLASALTVSCLGSSAVDMYLGTDAGAGFHPDTAGVGDTGPGTGGSSGVAGATGTGGDTGTGGVTGSDDGGTDA